MEAVVQDDCLEPLVYHPFDDLPNCLEEADAAIIAASFRDKDCNNPAELGGYLALVPDCLDELHQRLPILSGAYIRRPRLRVLLQLCPFEPPFQVLCPHP